MSLEIAIIGGLMATIAAILFLQIWEVARPSHHHVRIVTLIGSAFTRKPILQQLMGRAVLFSIGICYGIFTSAVVYAFELEAVGWIFGIVVAIPLWMLTGISLTYFRLLHPLIRTGEMKAPGPFALGYSRQSAVMLLIAHLIFGLVCGFVYGAVG